jgi:GH18 family chitinase
MMMKKQYTFMLAMALTVLIALLPNAPHHGASVAEGQNGDSEFRLVGYYPSYAIYEDYFVTDIAAGELTHLNYGWGTISVNGQCESSDLWTDTQYAYPNDTRDLRLRGNIRQLQLLRGEHPNLKIHHWRMGLFGAVFGCCTDRRIARAVCQVLCSVYAPILVRWA